MGISSNSTKKRRENGYGHNPELREAIRNAGGIRKIGIYILEEVDDAVTAGRLEAYYVNEVYSRSDYDGRRWWTTWFDCPDDRPDKQLAGKIDAFQTALMAMPEFQSLWHMKRMCRLYAARTSDPTEFNLYSETDQLYIWLRMITREKDYNLYVHFYEASRKDA